MLRLENTALYFGVGVLLSKIGGPSPLIFFSIAVVGAIVETLFWRNFVFESSGDVEEDFKQFLNVIIESVLVYLPVGYFFGRFL
ncbi:MAG: hypothetical protein QXF97_06480 [Candidatus Caldarchaeum sp.]